MRDAKQSLANTLNRRAVKAEPSTPGVVTQVGAAPVQYAPPQPTFNGVPPGDVLESLFSDAITSAHAAVDVACEGSSNLTTERAIRVACYVGTLEANRILTKLEGHSTKSLRVRHRGLVKVWPTAVARMTDAVAQYDGENSEENAAGMARAVLGFVDISHKVMSIKTKKKERDLFIAEYLED